LTSRISFEADRVISQTAEYALRAVVCLGASPGQPLTTQAIAAKTRVPAGYLSKVLQALGRAGMVDSQRGPHGGHVLTRSLDALTVLDVINAVDPLKRIERCPLGLAAHRTQMCSLHKRLDEGMALVASLFGGTTIADLLAEANPSQPLCDEVVAIAPR
jgi:Rrf2 family protein